MLPSPVSQSVLLLSRGLRSAQPGVPQTALPLRLPGVVLVLLWLAGAGLSWAQLPAGWSDLDIGEPGVAGSASYANEVWTVAGGGSDIWNSADQFHYACQSSSDTATIVARVTGQQNTDAWAKAGVMFRDDTTAGARFAIVVVTPGNGVSFQWRLNPNDSCGYAQGGGVSVPVWVKMVRQANTFSGYYSNDGTTWTAIGQSQTMAMAVPPLVGLAVSAHNNGLLSTATFSNVSVSNAPPPPPPVFGVYRELWTGLSWGGLEALTNTAFNPNWPDNPTAIYTKTYSAVEAEANTGLSSYGQRLRTFVVPPASGNYTFWISSDDASQLFLSSDESPANQASIASVASWTDVRQWNKEANQQSAPVALEAGRRYYLEAIMAQGGGGDNLAVRWQLPDGTFEEPLADASPAGTRLVVYRGVESPPGIYQQPTNLTVLEGLNATFTLLVTNPAAVSYQWRLNGTPLAGATARKPFYIISNASLALNNGQIYSCLVSNAADAVASAAATLTVTPDRVAPTIVRVYNLGPTNVQVVYSEAVEIVSATTLSNYGFTNNISIRQATLGADNQTVTLTTAPLVYGSNYTLVINNVRDRASTPNLITSNTRLSFVATPFATQDLGNPPVGSISTPVGTTGLDVTALGNDIGDYADQGSFQFQLRTGDFDLSLRLAGLAPSDVWAKAGLMARETLDASSRFAAALATPAMNGAFFECRANTGAQAGTTGNFPANYPNTWLRLKRAGNLFTGFASYDGQTWSQLGSVSLNLPAQIFLGPVVSSHATNQTTFAQFRDIAEVTTNSLVAQVTNPHEPLGPSSRTTPLVISEINYKPAPRSDTNNLEFIELYNSNPWFQDIGGYQLKADNLTYTFPPGSRLSGGAFLVVAASPQSLQTVYNLTNVVGPYSGSLKKSDTLQLLDEQGAVLLTIPYSSQSPWPVAAEGTGHSLVLANPSYGEADPKAWDISDQVGGSPGQMDAYRPSPLRNVLINEFLAHTDPPDYDYIELYNHANTPVDLSGCILTDDPTTNKFILPAGTILPARGFVAFYETNMGFALNAAGETLYLKNPDQSRVLDAVSFQDQENGVATGRWPDGAEAFYRLSAKSPGTNNASVLISQVVINELMYHPISGNDDDQYIELYNRGTMAVDLSGWTLSDAVSFTFPSNTVLAADGYLVVARNATHLRTNYANLNLTNCLGDFSGKLSHQGEHLTLTMPDSITSTNKQGVVSTNWIHIQVCELTYGKGGRWGQWAAGGGSSLELLEPGANPRLAANWADSDETQKAPWANFEATGVLDNGANYEPAILHAQIGLLDVGECLVDNVEVRAGTTGTNLVVNPGFESGANNWAFQGAYCRSSLENSGYSGSRSLHIRASDGLWTGANSCQMDLYNNTLAEGQTATLRFQARWLRGWPEVLMRLNGNWLEATGRLPVPANLGTPGARNSRFLSNAGPAIYQVSHTPSVPAASQAVVVTARAHDPNGLQNPTLYYRTDPATTYATVALKDDGTGGDAIAGDGLFSATIPGQAANTIVAFYLSAQDSKGATSRFPALLNTQAPAPECVVLFGDGNPSGSFGVYHLWITQTNATRWNQLSDLSNEAHDSTFVYGPRVIYNVQGRFAGSPYHQGFDWPYGNLCHYKWVFPDDDQFLGATSFNKIHQPGNGAGDDASLQREQIANTFLRALGVPWLYRHYVVVYVNGNRRGSLMEDAQTPGGDIIDEYFPQDNNGWLYKMQPWFEFGPDDSTQFNNVSWCNLMPYTTTGGVKKVARYRYNFLARAEPVSNSDYTNVFSLVDAASSYGSANYVANMEKLANMENWMRVFAANHAAGNWDSFGSQNAQNLYGYIGAQGTKYSLLMFDFNISIGNSGSWGPGQSLFAVNGQDPNTANLYNEPTFRRMYWRAFQELVDGPLDVTKSGPLLDAKYRAFAANGIAAENPNANIKGWLTAARASIAAQLAAENTASFTVNPSVSVNNGVATVTGTAPVDIKTVWINGAEYPLTWTSLTGWKVTVPLKPGSNPLSVVGVDMHAQPVAGASNLVTVAYNGTMPSPVGQVVINEVMFNPPLPGAEYVELYNRSSSTTYDLSGWQFRGLSYTFPAGAVLGPKSYLVLAANPLSFAAAYGATTPVFDAYSGTLQGDGETLALVQPGTNAATDLVVAKLRYGTTAPWPTATNTPGSSLQLQDPSQDIWRVGNWTAVGDPQWVFVTTNIPATSSSVLYLYLASPGDLYLDDVKLLRSGTNALVNGDFESPLSTGWTATANFANSTVSTTVKRVGNASLHLVATAGGTGGNNSVYQAITPALTTGQTYTLSFWYLQSTNGSPLVVRLSSSVNPVSLNPAPPALARATPGTANSVATTLNPFPSLWINEVQAENLTGITNRAGQHTPWLELYNPSTNTLALDGLYLANNCTNLLQWAFPAGATISPRQFKTLFADGQTNLSTLSELHTSFGLSAGAGALVLSRLATNASLQVLDYLTYTNLSPNHSFGSLPDGQSFDRQEFFFATPGGTNNGSSAPITVLINEWMADNTVSLADPADNDLEDWFELYNPGTNAVDLGGFYLTDTLTNKFQFEIPNTHQYVIPPHGFLLVWADGESKQNATNRADLHVNFKLDKAGEAIGLFGADGALVDYVSFGPQTSDVSMGRYPDGGSTIAALPRATPRTNNAAPNTAPVLTPLGNRFVYLGQSVSFTVPASDADWPPQQLTYSLDPGAPANVVLDASSGAFIWTPTAAQTPSTNQVTVRVSDNGLPPLEAAQTFTITVQSPPSLGAISLNGSTLTLGCPTVPGKLYRLEYKDTLTAPTWTPVGTAQPGNGTPLVFNLDLSSAPNRFYRIVVTDL